VPTKLAVSLPELCALFLLLSFGSTKWLFRHCFPHRAATFPVVQRTRSKRSNATECYVVAG